MKKFLITIAIAVCTLPIFAQSQEAQFIVYQVSGKVTTVVGKSKEVPVERKQVLSIKDKLRISGDAFVKLLDRQNQKMYTLRSNGMDIISKLIEQEKEAGKSLTKQYFSYVLRSLTRKDTDVLYDTGLTTGIYRNDADSLLCDIDSLQTVVDSLQHIIKNLINDSIKKP